MVLKYSTRLRMHLLAAQFTKQKMNTCCFSPVLHKHSYIRKQSFVNLNNTSYHYSTNIVTSPFNEINIPNKLIQEIIWETVDRFPESIAVKCTVSGQTYTYAQVKKLSLRLSNCLRKAGFRKGDVVSVISPNCPDFPIIVLGALEAGMIVSFVNSTYTVDEISNQLKDSGTVCVMTGANQLNTVQAAINKNEETTKTKLVKRVIVLDTINKLESVEPGVTRYSEMIAEGIDHTIKYSGNVDINEVALMPYSSGTTGVSKGVKLSHRNVVANSCQVDAVEGAKIHSPEQGQDLLLGLLPFSHAYGLVVILLTGLQRGGQIVSLPKFDQQTFIKTLESEQLSFMMLVPPLIMFLGSSPKITQKHLEKVRFIISATAPLTASAWEKLNTKLSQSDCIISQAYGLTEASPVITIPKVPAKNHTTVGAPISNTLGKIINSETGEALGPHQRGELCFKGPQIMIGYHNNPKATAEIIDGDGWLKTGDIGYYDEDGHFYIQDRLKELIKVKGMQVSPTELEEVLLTHPSIKEVAVVGVPHPRDGESPVAFVVLGKDKSLSDQQLKKFLSVKVSRHKQVTEVIFLDGMPRTDAGKIRRKDLREMYKNKK